MTTSPIELTDLAEAVETLRGRVAGPLCVAAPLSLGKPHRLQNALYARVERDPSRPLHLYTTLSLDPPKADGDLEERFLALFVARGPGQGWACRRVSSR